MPKNIDKKVKEEQDAITKYLGKEEDFGTSGAETKHGDDYSYMKDADDSDKNGFKEENEIKNKLENPIIDVEAEKADSNASEGNSVNDLEKENVIFNDTAKERIKNKESISDTDKEVKETGLEENNITGSSLKGETTEDKKDDGKVVFNESIIHRNKTTNATADENEEVEVSITVTNESLCQYHCN